MRDLIDRAAAIDALDGVSWMHLEGKHEICDGDWIKADEAEEALKQLPSAHSEERTNERTETHACDLISRQDAIDANDAAFWETKNKKHYTKLKMLQSHAFLVETALKDLPSAQPTQTNTPNALESLDCISRQAAIDAVKCGALSAAMVYGRTDEGSTALFETVKAIKAIPPAQPTVEERKWIPCNWHTEKENLPQECKSVLICIKDSYGYRIGVSYRTDYNRWEGFGRVNVIAWMPLPEPYTEGAK